MLGLGNRILADDAFGIYAARAVEERLGDAIHVMISPESGVNLVETLMGTSPLLIVDTIQTGTAPPGTMHVFEEEQCRWTPGESLHRMGAFEVLAFARKLGLPVPDRVTVIAVEAADCSTVGGAMHPDVRAAIPRVVDWVNDFLRARGEADAA